MTTPTINCLPDPIQLAAGLWITRDRALAAALHIRTAQSLISCGGSSDYDLSAGRLADLLGGDQHRELAYDLLDTLDAAEVEA